MGYPSRCRDSDHLRAFTLFELLQKLPPTLQRHLAFSEVVVQVLDAFHALESAVQAALGHMRIDAERSEVGACGTPEGVGGEVRQAVLDLAHCDADGRFADVRQQAASIVGNGMSMG